MVGFWDIHFSLRGNAYSFNVKIAPKRKARNTAIVAHLAHFQNPSPNVPVKNFHTKGISTVITQTARDIQNSH